MNKPLPRWHRNNKSKPGEQPPKRRPAWARPTVYTEAPDAGLRRVFAKWAGFRK